LGSKNDIEGYLLTAFGIEDTEEAWKDLADKLGYTSKENLIAGFELGIKGTE